MLREERDKKERRKARRGGRGGDGGGSKGGTSVCGGRRGSQVEDGPRANSLNKAWSTHLQSYTPTYSAGGQGYQVPGNPG